MRAISRRVKWRAELEVRKKPAGEKIRAVCRVYLARLRVKDLERKLWEEDEAAASKLVEHLRGEFARHDGDRSGTLTHAELTALIQARYEVRHNPPRLPPAQPTIRSKSPHGRKDSLKPAPRVSLWRLCRWRACGGQRRLSKGKWRRRSPHSTPQGMGCWMRQSL